MLDYRSFGSDAAKLTQANQMIAMITAAFGNQDTALDNSSSISVVLNHVPSDGRKAAELKQSVAAELNNIFHSRRLDQSGLSQPRSSSPSGPDKRLFHAENMIVFDPSDSESQRTAIAGLLSSHMREADL